MLNHLMFALLPVIFTFALGYFAAAKGSFDDRDSRKLVSLVMNVMLPMSVFAGIWGTPRKIIIQDIPLAGWLIIGMVGSYFSLLLIHRFIMKTPISVSLLRAMSVAMPSVPFIGSAILPPVFGASLSAITIGVCSLVINVIMLPVAYALLDGEKSANGNRVLTTLRKPLVASALGGFALALLGWQMPANFAGTFELLGKGAGGLAIFATGVVLFTKKISVSKTIFATVTSKNIIFPLVVWGLMLLFNLPSEIRRVVVVTLAIPTAVMPTSLGIQFNVNPAELASTQFWSTVVSAVSLAIFLMALS
ncbi:malate transporter [Lentilactobacillus curieae]|uniref:Malate transporter n=1 Tax=Lentilactobacillus curieae TaxID=1138822 RepID=A0A1S6QIL8_9LACO|nr:AEC family transporter [Lentilactobacillus curieae]AQW21443.1 malate transporter [Lentilactobacillus curieae]